jgi:3-deoxy-D-manno-octulosonic-acid transferase
VVALGGNLKADLPPPRPLHPGWTALRTAWAGAPVLVAGNTVAGEEEPLLEVWTAARRQFPELRLILAPRQPRRFEAVASLFTSRGLAFHRASLPWPEEGTWTAREALLLDTLGELPAAYAEGTVALVAGGWAAPGGHNPVESVRAGLPTVIGPGFSNFEDLVAPLVAAGRLTVVDLAELEASLLAHLAHVPLRPSAVAPLPEPLAGALDRTWALIAPQLPLVR